jgi:solute carrier family 25 (mitochondrial phosphate transporter), member 23/24/25/41
MAATMAVATMVTKSKESWSLHLSELALPWNSHEGRNSVEFPRCALFASVSLNTPLLEACDPLEHDTRARPRPTDNYDIACQLEAVVKGKQEGEVEEEMTDQHKKKGICGKTQQHKLGALRKKLLHVRIANPHMRRLVSGAITGAV